MPKSLKEALAAVPVAHRAKSKASIEKLGLPRQRWVYLSKSEVQKIVLDLGGLTKAAQYFGVQNCTVTRWKAAERIPSWAKSLYEALKRKGHQFDSTPKTIWNTSKNPSA